MNADVLELPLHRLLRGERLLTRLLLVTVVDSIGRGMFLTGPAVFVLAAAVVAVGQQGNSAVRSGAVGRAYPGPERVRIRATIRSGTNVGIGIGTAVAAVSLASGSPVAYRVTFVAAAAMLILSAVVLTSVDHARVVAPSRRLTGIADGHQTLGGTSPWRNGRFLVLTSLTGLFGIQFGVFEVAVPVWVVHQTAAPRLLVPLLLLLVNTLVSVLLQVRFSRGTGTVRGAADAMLRAGAFMAVACCLWVAGAAVPAAAVAVLVAAALAHTLAELLSSAAGWALGFEFAPIGRVGAYQGVYGTGNAAGAMMAPAVATWATVGHGAIGWAGLALLFLVTAVGTSLTARTHLNRSSHEHQSLR